MRCHYYIALLLLAACARAPRPSGTNRYADPVQREIATAQDERRTADLLPLLRNSSPTYRAAAAEALGSVQDRAAAPALLPLLRDPWPGVRRAAAYALGQTADSLSTDSLRVRVLLEKDPVVRRVVQQALGRCVTPSRLPELWRVEVLTDTSRAAALAGGLERAAIKGLTSAESIRRAVLLLSAFKLKDADRLAAAVALARTRGRDADLNRLATPVLLRLAQKDGYYAVRAAAATALGRALAAPADLAISAVAAAGPSPALAALLRLAGKDGDWRVRVAALRALPWADGLYASSRPTVLAALAERRPGVALTAAEWLLAHGRGETGADLAARADKLPLGAWRPRAVLLAAALRLASPASRPALALSVQKRYAAAPTPYEKGALLQTLGEDTGSYAFVEIETFAAGQSPIVAGSGLSALVAMRRGADFPAAQRPAVAAALRRALASGDQAQLGTAAEALADPAVSDAPGPDDLTALRTAQAKLRLPRDIEAWQTIQQTLDKLEKRPVPTPTPVGKASQHPIDWAAVQRISPGQRVRLRTTQGDIVLAMKVNEAPGAVTSFVALVQQKFYDGLFFHRVVPNFVAQGGDPRGDGSGSAPYTLRSELPELYYGEGSVGLASAGKDTESCQFFITHGPTPHLDGRYPIFAQVVEGLEVVPKIEIGDRIISAELL